MMNKDIMTDLGENYEYIRTIIDKKIEMAKIDILITTSRSLGYILLAILLFVLFGIFVASLMVALAIVVANFTASIITGVLLASLSLVLIAISLFYFRKALIFNPITALFYRLISNNK